MRGLCFDSVPSLTICDFFINTVDAIIYISCYFYYDFNFQNYGNITTEFTLERSLFLYCDIVWIYNVTEKVPTPRKIVLRYDIFSIFQ